MDFPNRVKKIHHYILLCLFSIFPKTGGIYLSLVGHLKSISLIIDFMSCSPKVIYLNTCAVEHPLGGGLGCSFIVPARYPWKTSHYGSCVPRDCQSPSGPHSPSCPLLLPHQHFTIVTILLTLFPSGDS